MLLQVSGSFIFVFCVAGWYVWLSLILASVDFPFNLPLGDLSNESPRATSVKDIDNNESDKTKKSDRQATKQA